MKEKEDEDYFEEGNTGEFYEVDEEYLYYNGDPDRGEEIEEETDEEYAYRMEETTGNRSYHYADDEGGLSLGGFIAIIIFFLYWLFS